MGFYRVYSERDTWITNRANPDDTSVTSSGSNHGASPSLNIFALSASVSPNAMDVARSLIKFGLTELSGKIYTDMVIPSSSVTYKLKMFNMAHADTVPSSYDLFIFPLSRSWDEGVGNDDDTDRDGGVANWVQPISTADWVVAGSDYLTASYGSASQHFDDGQEDLEVNVTDMVTCWLTGAIANNGIVVKLGSTEESTGDYFRKAFHSRQSKYIDRLPYIEAQFEDTIKDHRDNFAINQDNNLYLYNVIRGELTDLSSAPTVRLQDSIGSASIVMTSGSSRVTTGIYRATFHPTSIGLSSSWADIWYVGSTVYMSGTVKPLILTGSQADVYGELSTNVDNLKRVYGTDEKARLLVTTMDRDYVTHVGPLHSASSDIESLRLEKMYYSIVNDDSGEVIVPFGTGSIKYTQLSYDGNGNYFDLYMSSFVPGFVYRIKFLVDINRERKIYDEGFRFKVV